MSCCLRVIAHQWPQKFKLCSNVSNWVSLTFQYADVRILANVVMTVWCSKRQIVYNEVFKVNTTYSSLLDDVAKMANMTRAMRIADGAAPQDGQFHFMITSIPWLEAVEDPYSPAVCPQG